MSRYWRALIIAVILHSSFLLWMITVNWPQQQQEQQIGWQQAKIIQSYLFQAKPLPQQQSHQLSHAVESKNHTVQYRITAKATESAAQKPQSNNLSTSATISKGQYNRLLILLHNAIAEKQVYPASAAMLGQKGVVLAGFSLSTSGEISAIRINKSSGFTLLDQAAIAAIQQISPFTLVKISKQLDLTVAIRFESQVS